ncbi:MAG: isopentenyl phosphate kinase [Halobacteriota archaeon]
MILLKIGGSVITDKAREKTIKEANVCMVAQQIANTKVPKLMLVHGAGSFGHPQAIKYLSEGFSAQGIWKTHAAVCLLNTTLVNELQSKNVPALPVHPLDHVVVDRGKIVEFNLVALQLMLENNIVPVIHGDVVMDRSRRFSILSGDQLVSYLARMMLPQKTGVGTDVDGIIYKGKTIRHLTPANFERYRAGITGSDNMDVTGGMLRKVSELIDLAKLGIQSQIFDATKEGNIAKFLAAGDDLGTTISAE